MSSLPAAQSLKTKYLPMKIKRWQDLLRRLKLEHIRATAPGFFEQSGGYDYKPKPYTDKTANGLTTSIEDFINYLPGGYGEASRINSTGTPRVIGGRISWTKGNTRKGLADIRATFRGRSISIEIKIGADRQSEAQIKEQERITRAGGLYFIAKDFPSFLSWWLSVFPETKELMRIYDFDTSL